jgi:hypothetical protein
MNEDRLQIDDVEKEFLSVLANRDVRYVVIGGHAVNFHGYQRPVNDIDVVIDNSMDNAQKFIIVLADLKMKGQEVTVDNISKPKKKINILFYNADVLTSIDDVPFNELYRDRIILNYNGLEFGIISKNHLLIMKLSSERPEDQRDYKALVKIN